MIHAQHYWPEMITTILWPYTWQAIEYRDNVFGLNMNGRHPVRPLGGTVLHFNTRMEGQHTWGCTVFVFESKAANNSMPK